MKRIVKPWKDPLWSLPEDHRFLDALATFNNITGSSWSRENYGGDKSRAYQFFLKRWVAEGANVLRRYETFAVRVAREYLPS